MKYKVHHSLKSDTFFYADLKWRLKIKYKQITKEERAVIEVLFNEKKSFRSIAKIMKRHHTTIAREIKRNKCWKCGNYNYEKANFCSKRTANHKHYFKLLKYAEFINFFYKHFEKRYHGVYLTYQLALKKLVNVRVPSYRQVYNWIKNRRFAITKKDLLHPTCFKGGRRKVGKIGRIFKKWMIPIGLRPKLIDQRQRYGDFEVDLIVGQRTNKSHHLLTMVDRKSRFGYIMKVLSKNEWIVYKTIRDHIVTNNIDVKSITIDNGHEFSKFGLLGKEFNFKVYYCQPYCSFQRGTNENFNGLVRRTWKKTTTFNNISTNEINNVQSLINNMPRKMFYGMSAKEIYNCR